MCGSSNNNESNKEKLMIKDRHKRDLVTVYIFYKF